MGAANEVVSSGTCAGGPGREKERKISIAPAAPLHRGVPAWLPTYLPTHLVKINNYDETYEAAANAPAMIRSTTWKPGSERGIRASFINRGIPPVKHSRQHNRAAVGEPGFSLGVRSCDLRFGRPVDRRMNLESISSRGDTDSSNPLLLIRIGGSTARIIFESGMWDVRKRSPDYLYSHKNALPAR